MKARSKLILVVDDEPKIVEVIQAFLENDGYQVVIAQNGVEALEVYQNKRPDLIVLDLMLPEISGEIVCKTIRQQDKTPIIMLTAKVDERDILQGLDMGADDYICKPFSPRELLARIQAVLRRTENKEQIQHNHYFDNGYLEILLDSYEVKVMGKMIDLTPTEFKILLTLSQSPQKVYTREQLIEYALDREFCGYDRTIDTYIKNIRQKIESDPKKPKLIVTVHGIGYKFGGEPC